MKNFDFLFYVLQAIDICAFLGTGIAISTAIHPAIENEGFRALANIALGWVCGSVLVMRLNDRYKSIRGVG
jgi:hypothetical protein